MEKTVLKPWEEVAGPLFEVLETGEFLRAKIGSENIILPSEMGNRLQDLVGHRIAILRTDEDYRIRNLIVREGESR